MGIAIGVYIGILIGLCIIKIITDYHDNNKNFY